jgi:5-methylcytosine-specific restriction endonuclease McrA
MGVVSTNLEVQRARHRAWRIKNKEHVDAYRKAYRATAKWREIHRKWSAQYRAKNLLKVREIQKKSKAQHRNPEYEKKWQTAHLGKFREYGKKWRAKLSAIKYVKVYRENNKEQFGVYRHRRRARLIGSGGDHTVTQWIELKEYFGNKCLSCGLPETEVQLERDHVIPVSQGGSNNIENIQPLCSRCNRKKYNKTIDFRGSVAA